jgi:glucose-1-phosphate cytidylyltransferase
LSYHLVDMDGDGKVSGIRGWDSAEIRINGGYFLLRPGIFEYMLEGEELVVEPFQRLIEANQLMAYRHDGFWRSMDTLKDRQVLEDMVEQGNMPWRRDGNSLTKKKP